MTLPPLPWLFGGVGLAALLGYLFWRSHKAAAAPVQPSVLPPAPGPTPGPTPSDGAAWTPVTLNASGPTMTVGPGTYRASIPVPPTAGAPPATIAAQMQQAAAAVGWLGFNVYLPGQTFPSDWPDTDPTELRIEGAIPAGMGPVPIPVPPGGGAQVWYSATAPVPVPAGLGAPVTPGQVVQSAPGFGIGLIVRKAPPAPAPHVVLMPVRLAVPHPAPAPSGGVHLLPIKPPTSVPWATYAAVEKTAQACATALAKLQTEYNVLFATSALSRAGVPPRPAPPPPPTSPASVVSSLFGIGPFPAPSPAPTYGQFGASTSPSGASASAQVAF